MDFEFHSKSNDRAPSRLINLKLAIGYDDRVTGREQQNYKTLQTILPDIACAISGQWKVVGKSGTGNAPDNAESIINNGRF